MRRSLHCLFCAALTAVLSASCVVAARAPQVTPSGVRFTLEHNGATSVAVVGSFNEWSTSSHPLTRQGRLWRTVVVLPPGDHLFMFVVDGTQWVVPPLADDYADDGFGSRNGVVSVR